MVFKTINLNFIFFYGIAERIPIRRATTGQCFRGYWQPCGKFVTGCQRILAIIREMCYRETDGIGKTKTLTNSKDDSDNLCETVSIICKRTMITLLSIWQKVSDNLGRHL